MNRHAFKASTSGNGYALASEEDSTFPNVKGELIDRIINEAGINRIRLELRSGPENVTDSCTRYLSGQIE